MATTNYLFLLLITICPQTPLLKTNWYHVLYFGMCNLNYRFTSWVKCRESPTLIRKFVDWLPHAAQHVFQISKYQGCKSLVPGSMSQGPQSPCRFTNKCLDFGEYMKWHANVKSTRQLKSHHVWYFRSQLLKTCWIKFVFVNCCLLRSLVRSRFLLH